MSANPVNWTPREEYLPPLTCPLHPRLTLSFCQRRSLRIALAFLVQGQTPRLSFTVGAGCGHGRPRAWRVRRALGADRASFLEAGWSGRSRVERSRDLDLGERPDYPENIERVLPEGRSACALGEPLMDDQEAFNWRFPEVGNGLVAASAPYHLTHQAVPARTRHALDPYQADLVAMETMQRDRLALARAGGDPASISLGDYLNHDPRPASMMISYSVFGFSRDGIPTITS